MDISIETLLARVQRADGPDREIDALLEIEYRKRRAYACGLDDTTRAIWVPIGSKGEVVATDDPSTRYHSQLYTDNADLAMKLFETMLPGTYFNVAPRFFIDGEIVKYRVTLIRPLWSKWTPREDWFDNYEGPDLPDRCRAILACGLSALIAQSNTEGGKEEGL